MIQVALRDTAMVKSVQKDLNSIAERVEGSNRWWYKFILTGKTANSELFQFYASVPCSHMSQVCYNNSQAMLLISEFVLFNGFHVRCSSCVSTVYFV